MAHKNKTRGNEAEERIATALTEVVGLRFARIPGSGSQSTQRYFTVQGINVTGDVACLDDPDFRFMIESKKVGRNNFSWDLLLVGTPPADFPKWWEKICRQAHEAGKYAMLVVSRNQGPMVCFTEPVAWPSIGMLPDHVTVPSVVYVDGQQIYVSTVEFFGRAYREAFKSRIRSIIKSRTKKGK